MTINVLEVRNYRLKPDMLEHFIDYFEEALIPPQELTQMQVIGQFRVVDELNRFVWLRGFSDMNMRLTALKTFYGGPVWAKYGPRANEMMLEWHNVHLLRPLDAAADLMHGVNTEHIAREMAEGTISPNVGMIAIDFYQAQVGKREALINAFQSLVMPAYKREAIQIRGLFVAEMSENAYTTPVIQNEEEFVVITAYENEDTYWENRDDLTQHISDTTRTFLSAAPNSLLLSPTLRSPLRYLHP